MNSPSKLFPNPAEKCIQSTKRKSRNSQNYRIFLITTWFSVEVAGVELNTIHTDNQQYIQTQKLTPMKTPSVWHLGKYVKWWKIRKHTAKIFKLFAYVNFFYLLCNVVITGRLYNEHRPNHKSGMHGRPYSRKMAREAVFVVDFFVALSGEVLWRMKRVARSTKNRAIGGVVAPCLVM